MAAALGIIADDFTGAMLVAGKLEAAGIEAPVAFHPEGLVEGPAGQIAILATRARVLSVPAARALIAASADALTAAGCPRLAYKASGSFDSTAEGNIGPAAELLSDRAHGLPVLMSAGFPAYGITVHQGYLFYRGRLVTESIKRQDPLTPMPDPDLARFLSCQTQSPVALLPHGVLRQGAEVAFAAWQAILDGGARHVLADTSDDGDVEVTVALALRRAAVVVGSDPLIIGYAQALAGAPVAPASVSPVQGPGAVIVGSVGPTATAQIARFATHGPVLTVDPADPRSDAALIAAALDWAAPRIGHTPFCIATATDEAEVARAQAALGAIGAARRAEALLSAIAVGLRDRGIRRLVVSGGETSGAVVAALGIRRMRALPDGPLGSGFCRAELPVPMALFLKSGKLGPEDVLPRALDAMLSP